MHKHTGTGREGPTGSRSSGRVVAELTDSDFDVPTTITFTAGSLYAVNARFGTAPDPATARYDIVRVNHDDHQAL